MVLEELSFNLAPLLASAGILGLAVGFGAQSLVKDLLGGLFMLLEDQYGVGDTVDLGEATGMVESVGLRITTVRDGRGVLWYIRNGEIIRVGNKSQGWAMLLIDMPIGFADAEEATEVLRAAAATVYADPVLAEHFVEPPEVLGVETVTVEGTVIRTVAKTTADGQYVVGRELRRRLTEALASAGITAQLAANRVFPRPATPESGSWGLSSPIPHIEGRAGRGRAPVERSGIVRSFSRTSDPLPFALASCQTIGQNPSQAHFTPDV